VKRIDRREANAPIHQQIFISTKYMLSRTMSRVAMLHVASKSRIAERFCRGRFSRMLALKDGLLPVLPNAD